MVPFPLLPLQVRWLPPEWSYFCFRAFSFLICMPEKRSKLILKCPFPSWMARHQQNKSIYFTQALWCSCWLRSCRNPVNSNILSVHKAGASQRSRRTGAGTVSSWTTYGKPAATASSESLLCCPTCTDFPDYGHVLCKRNIRSCDCSYNSD